MRKIALVLAVTALLSGCNGGVAQIMPQPVPLPGGKLGYSFSSMSSFDNRSVREIAAEGVDHFKLCPAGFDVVASNDRHPSLRIVDVVIACH